MSRLIFQFEEVGELKFISHLELLRLMERAFRRAELPLKFSQGFNPHPKLAFAYPLSVGVSSVCELMDVELVEKLDAPFVMDIVNRVLPPGIHITKAKYTESKESLMGLVRLAEYEVLFNLSAPFREEAFEAALASDCWIHQKQNKKKQYVEHNIRPQILELKHDQLDGKERLRMKIHHSSDSSLKPDVVLSALLKKMGIEEVASGVRIHRLSLIGIKGLVEKPLFDCL